MKRRPRCRSQAREGYRRTRHIYDYCIGGKDNVAVDREVGRQVAEVAPWVVTGARAHARALLARDEHTIAVRGDARDPDAVLDDPAVGGHLDLDRPVAVLLIAVLHFLTGPDEPVALLAALRQRLAPGSFLVISHVADLSDGHETAERAAATQTAAELYDHLAGPFTLRTPKQIAALFTGFDLLPPGIVPVHRWRPGRGRPGPAVPVLAGLGHLIATTPTTAHATGDAHRTHHHNTARSRRTRREDRP